MHKDMSGQGLEIVGVPCNQFGGQEPGTPADITAFVTKFGVAFKMTEKIDVQGDGAHPLYKVMNPGNDLVKWNFTKFLVNSQGQVVKHYAHGVAPNDIKPDIQALLA